MQTLKQTFDKRLDVREDLIVCLKTFRAPGGLSVGSYCFPGLGAPSGGSHQMRGDDVSNISSEAVRKHEALKCPAARRSVSSSLNHSSAATKQRLLPPQCSTNKIR